MDDHYKKIIAFLLHFLPHKDTLRFQKTTYSKQKILQGCRKIRLSKENWDPKSVEGRGNNELGEKLGN